MKLHIYSDINLRYLDFADPVDETPPLVDAVIVAGNISTDVKRSLLFQETLGQHLIPIFINFGSLEFSKGSYCLDSMRSAHLRYSVKKDTNCYYKHNINVVLPELKLDVLPMFGWPTFGSQEELDATSLGKINLEVVWGMHYDEHGVAINSFDPYPTKWYRINELHQIEQDVLKSWLSDQHVTENKKVLIVGNDYNTLINSMDLTNVVVVTPNAVPRDAILNNGRLVSNPGSGALPRSNVLVI